MAKRKPRASMRSLIALARARIARTPAGRLAWFFAAATAFGFGVVAAGLAAAGSPLGGLVARAAAWNAWLSGGLVAFAAAGKVRARDRKDGIDVLAASRGLSAYALDAARLLGAMLHATLAVGAPVVALALFAMAVAGSARAAFARLGLVFGALIFAVVAGVTLGGLGAVAGRIGRDRGPLLLAVLVFGPWMIEGWLGRGVFSIPDALEGIITMVLRKGGTLS